MNVRIDWSKFPPVEQAANPAQVASIVSASSDRDYIYSLSLPLSLLSDESLWCQAHLDQLTPRGRSELQLWLQRNSSPSKLTLGQRPVLSERKKDAVKCAHCLEHPAGFAEAPNSVFCSRRCRQQHRASRMILPHHPVGFGPIRQSPPLVRQLQPEYNNNNAYLYPSVVQQPALPYLDGSTGSLIRQPTPLGQAESMLDKSSSSPASSSNFLPLAPAPSQPSFQSLSAPYQHHQRPIAHAPLPTSPGSTDSEDNGDLDPYRLSLVEFANQMTVGNLRALMAFRSITLATGQKNPLKPERITAVVDWYYANSTWQSFKSDLLQINVQLKDIDLMKC